MEQDIINIYVEYRPCYGDKIAYGWNWPMPMFDKPETLRSILMDQIQRMMHEIKLMKVDRDFRPPPGYGPGEFRMVER